MGKGTYSDILRSGIDFASLLKKPEEDDQSPLPGTPSHPLSRIRTFSESSVWSMESSVQSQKDGAVEPPPSVSKWNMCKTVHACFCSCLLWIMCAIKVNSMYKHGNLLLSVSMWFSGIPHAFSSNFLAPIKSGDFMFPSCTKVCDCQHTVS